MHPGDAEFACTLVNHTMSPYWRARRMAFSRRKFMALWPCMDVAIIQYSSARDGFIGWDRQGDIAHLRELHLVDQARGQGIGSCILTDWLELERALGAREAHLKVFENNPARRLYERMGFQFAGLVEHSTGLMAMHCTL